MKADNKESSGKVDQPNLAHPAPGARKPTTRQ